MNRKYEIIFEKVYVETPLDTDRDGKLDLIAVYIRRPRMESIKVPAIFVANPYMLTCNEEWYIPHDVDIPIKEYPTQEILEKDVKYDFRDISIVKPVEERITKGYAETSLCSEEVDFECISELYEHFEQLGYASIFAGGLGTKDSEGITMTGSQEEVYAFKAVIDWLNGRCRAFTDKENNIEVKADWCTGKVAMSAKSYLGTMCIGVATTGVEGLETIIPEAAISNWYDYYRSNGLNVPALDWQGDDLDILSKYCFSRAKDEEDYSKVKEVFENSQELLVRGEDRDSGNYNIFWDERNYLNQVKNIKASVLIIHGLNDWNVKTNQCIPFFEALQEANIPRKMILHQGAHIYIYNLKGSGVLGIIEKWLEYYLKGVKNGIENDTKLLIQNNLNQSKWHKEDTFPVKDCRNISLSLENDSEYFCFEDNLKSTKYWDNKDLREWRDELILAPEDNSKRLLFKWNLQEILPEKLGDDGNIRISGSASIAFKASIDQPTGIFSVMLVDLGEECRITEEQIEENGMFEFDVEESPSSYKVISRISMNAQNRTCNYRKEKIESGEFYMYTMETVPTDYTIKKGHQLGIVIYGIDAEQTQRSDVVTNVKIEAKSIQISIPVVCD